MALIDPIASPQFLRQLLAQRGSGYKKVGGLGLDWPDMYYEQRPSVEMIEREAIPPYDEQSQPQPFGSGYHVLGNPKMPQPLVFSGDASMQPPGGMAIDPVWNNITEMLHQQRRQGALLAEKIPPFFPGYTQGELPPNPWAASPGVTPPYPSYPPEAGILGMGGSDQGAPVDYPQAAGSPQSGAGGGLFGRMRSGLSNNWLPIMQAGLGMMAGGGWGRMPRDFLQIAGEAGGPALQTKMNLDQQAFRNRILEGEEESRRVARNAFARQAEAQAQANERSARAEAGIQALVEQYNSIDPADPLANEKRWAIAQRIAFAGKETRDEMIKALAAERKPGDLKLEKFPALDEKGQPMIDPRTGDQIFEQWYVDKAGERVKRVPGTIIGSGGVRMSVSSQMFDPTKSAYDVEQDMRRDLEERVKEPKAGLALTKQFEEAMRLGTSSGYKAAATIAQKLIEPGNQALINEISRLEGGGDFIERVRGALSQFMVGTPSAQQIADLKKFAGAMEKAYRERAIKERKTYRGLATQYQGSNKLISPERIVLPDEELDAWEALQK